MQYSEENDESAPLVSNIRRNINRPKNQEVAHVEQNFGVNSFLQVGSDWIGEGHDQHLHWQDDARLVVGDAVSHVVEVGNDVAVDVAPEVFVTDNEVGANASENAEPTGKVERALIFPWVCFVEHFGQELASAGVGISL